jgi:hypothetical protein
MTQGIDANEGDNDVEDINHGTSSHRGTVESFMAYLRQRHGPQPDRSFSAGVAVLGGA